MVGAEGGDFNDFAAEVHVHQLETAANHAGIAEFGPNLLRGGAGGHVEVFRFKVQQQVAHAATDQIGLVAGLLQAFDHADGVTADFTALDRMLAAAQHFRRAVRMFATANGGTEGLEQLFQHGRHCLTK